MVNKIIEQIAKNIDEIYGNIPIYTEYMRQNFLTPSFFIRNVKNIEKRLLSNRYNIFNEIEIIYYCEKGDSANENMNEISQILLEKLRSIRYDNAYIDSKNMNVDFLDGDKIKINIEYEYYIFRTYEDSKMERIIS